MPELLQAAREARCRVARVVAVSGEVAAEAELRRAKVKGVAVVLVGASGLDNTSPGKDYTLGGVFFPPPCGEGATVIRRPDGVIVAKRGSMQMAQKWAPGFRAGLARALDEPLAYF